MSERQKFLVHACQILIRSFAFRKSFAHFDLQLLDSLPHLPAGRQVEPKEGSLFQNLSLHSYNVLRCFKKKPARRHTQTTTSTKTYQPPNQHAGMKQALRYANNEKLLNYPDWKERVHKACIRACEGDQTRTGIIMLYLSRWSSPLMSSQLRNLCQSFAHRFNIWLFRSSLLSYYCCDPVNRASWLPPHY